MWPPLTQRMAVSDRSRLAAAASQGIARLIEGSPTPIELLGATTRGAWFQVRDHVIVVNEPGPARLPNGVTVGGLDWPLPQLRGDLAVGGGTLQIGANQLTIARWWNPRPTLQEVAPEMLATVALAAQHLLVCSSCDPLETALRYGDNFIIREALLDLVGRGPGLTPEGDDVLVGVLSGLRLLGPAVGAEWAEDLLCRIESILLVEAPFRTTSLSVALLRHAAAGEVAAPVGEFLQSLTGSRELVDAVDQLRDMGDTSGSATACGVLVAARVLTEEDLHGR